MPHISTRVLAVLSGSVIVGVACGLAIAPRLHAHAAQGPAFEPTLMELDPSFHTANLASQRIDVDFPTAIGKTPAGAVILPRDANGRVVLDIKRQGYNNIPLETFHRALVQFFPAVQPGQQAQEGGVVPLHEFELPLMKLRPGGVDNFNIATREGFVVPPGHYSLVVATAVPSGPKLSPRVRFVEKNPKGFWKLCSSERCSVSVR